MRTNQDYKNDALKALSGNWAHAVIAAIVMMLLSSLLISPSYINSYSNALNLGLLVPGYVVYGGGLLIMFILYPLLTGFNNSFRVLYETGDNRLTANTFHLGFSNWLHVSLGMIVCYLYIVLWSLLFVIPGIIKAFSYAMTPYILVEHPEMSINQAIDESRRLMKGHKFDYFYLELSFIGWAILSSVFTLGIGFIWLIPYISTSAAAFYNDLKNGESETPTPERVL